MELKFKTPWQKGAQDSSEKLRTESGKQGRKLQGKGRGGGGGGGEYGGRGCGGRSFETLKAPPTKNKQQQQQKPATDGPRIKGNETSGLLTERCLYGSDTLTGGT